jgi:hypothetical protein
MNANTETMSLLAREIAESEARLRQLEWEIEEIGQPAAHELLRRLDALKIEEHALQRNLSELLGMDEPDPVRMRNIEALLHYIEQEETSVKHDADFLHQSGPTSAEFATRAGARLGGLCLHALARLIGKHRPLGESVFVNHSHRMLAERYGIGPVEPRPPEP